MSGAATRSRQFFGIRVTKEPAATHEGSLLLVVLPSSATWFAGVMRLACELARHWAKVGPPLHLAKGRVRVYDPESLLKIVLSRNGSAVV